MGFEIEVDAGSEGKLWLRGCPDGTVELCKWGNITVKPGEPSREGLCAFKYYANPSQAFDKVFRMKVASCDAKSLQELVTEIKKIRKELTELLLPSLSVPEGNKTGAEAQKGE